MVQLRKEAASRLFGPLRKPLRPRLWTCLWLTLGLFVISFHWISMPPGSLFLEDYPNRSASSSSKSNNNEDKVLASQRELDEAVALLTSKTVVTTPPRQTSKTTKKKSNMETETKPAKQNEKVKESKESGHDHHLKAQSHDGKDDNHHSTKNKFPTNKNSLQHHHKHKDNSNRPPLTSLIEDEERGITGHVSFLLNWAILGHAKAGTTFIMNWISRHPDVATWDHEVCDLYDNKPAGLVKRLYEELPPDEHLQRGFKCPGHFSRRSLRYFHKFFKKTKLIIGVRHPVRWFESFYNFRTRHADANYTLPHPNQLTGECTPEKDGVCTSRANFQTNLAVLGKTPMKAKGNERDLIRFTKYKYEETYEISNPVFLYDVDQFAQGTSQFSVDLQNFLGLKSPLPEPTRKDAGISSRPKAKALNICLDEFKPLRKELIEIGNRASRWIQDYFLKSSQVTVSQEEAFREILKTWNKDPCATKKAES